MYPANRRQDDAETTTPTVSWGTGSPPNAPPPVEVSRIATVMSIAVGYGHSRAVLTGKKLKCRGFNANVQLGDGPLLPKPFRGG